MAGEAVSVHTAQRLTLNRKPKEKKKKSPVYLRTSDAYKQKVEEKQPFCLCE